MNIKEFLGNDPLGAVQADQETAGELLAKALGWDKMLGSPSVITMYRSPTFLWQQCEALATDLNLIHEAEAAVIEKVGFDNWYNALITIVRNTDDQVSVWTPRSSYIARSYCPTLDVPPV